MHIVGIPTFATFEEAVVQVEKIYDNTNDVIKVTGISSLTHVQCNQLYRIEGVNVGASKTFDAAPVTAITGVTTTGIGTQGVGDNGASLNRAPAVDNLHCLSVPSHAKTLAVLLP